MAVKLYLTGVQKIIKGLVVLAFDGGIDDEGYVRCYKGYQVTEKGTDTDIFQEEYRKEINYINKLLSN